MRTMIGASYSIGYRIMRTMIGDFYMYSSIGYRIMRTMIGASCSIGYRIIRIMIGDSYSIDNRL